MPTRQLPHVADDRNPQSTSRSVTISAWAIPVLIIGQFAMLAIIPVVLIVTGTLRDVRLRALRWWAAALAAAYATALILWAIGPDRAPSLSKDMNPIPALIVAAAVAFIIAHHTARRRSPQNR